MPVMPPPAELDMPMMADQSMEAPVDPEGEIKVMKEVLDRIEDSLRIERDFRREGQTIQQIYRGELTANGSPTKGSSRYNILNANTNILRPSLFSKNPKPDIRNRGFSQDPTVDVVIEALSLIADTFMDDTAVYDAFETAVKEVLLPGRGLARVRWDPIVETKSVNLGNGVPVEVHEKLLDVLGIEHVYWEDFTHEQVASWDQCGWEAFRHLFTEKEFEGYFGDSPAYTELVAAGQKEEIFRWTDKQAYQAFSKTTQQTRSRSPASNDLQDVIKKALVWEYWDKSTREIIWICQDMDGKVLRIDPDPLKLRNFFPNGKPLLAVTTSDKLLPKAEYTIYQDLAIELDEISQRIASLTKRLKVRGAYNGSQESLAQILKADDGEMIAVSGLDLNYELKNHIYLVPLTEVIQALQQLYMAREQAKSAMYEITGISDIVRGETRASETLGAQKMKAGFANLRVQDRKTMVENFCRDTIRIMIEIVSEHFSPESIFYYTGKMLDENAMTLLRNDALRLSRIDVETDSTVAPDEQADQQQIGMMLQALAQVLQQLGPMVMSGMIPMPIALEIVKMAIKPFKYSGNLNQLLNQYMAMMMGGAPGQGASPAAPLSGGGAPMMAPGQNMPRPGGADNRML